VWEIKPTVEPASFHIRSLAALQLGGGPAGCDDIEFSNDGVFAEDQDVVDSSVSWGGRMLRVLWIRMRGA
jgi:hypothetical protein